MKNKSTHILFMFSVVLMAVILSSIYGVTSLKMSPPENVFALSHDDTTPGVFENPVTQAESSEIITLVLKGVEFGPTAEPLKDLVVTAVTDLDSINPNDLDIEFLSGEFINGTNGGGTFEFNVDLDAGGFNYSSVKNRGPLSDVVYDVRVTFRVVNRTGVDVGINFHGQTVVGTTREYASGFGSILIKKIPAVAVCGDGNVEGAEQCDDGGTVDDDGCSALCVLEVCGDSVINDLPNETCDDGGNSATCDNDCSVAVCGDGLKNTAAGETCDDGNILDGDLCSSVCLSEAKRRRPRGDAGDTPSINQKDEDSTEDSMDTDSEHGSARVCKDELRDKEVDPRYLGEFQEYLDSLDDLEENGDSYGVSSLSENEQMFLDETIQNMISRDFPYETMLLILHDFSERLFGGMSDKQITYRMDQFFEDEAFQQDQVNEVKSDADNLLDRLEIERGEASESLSVEITFDEAEPTGGESSLSGDDIIDLGRSDGFDDSDNFSTITSFFRDLISY